MLNPDDPMQLKEEEVGGKMQNSALGDISFYFVSVVEIKSSE